MYRLTRVLGALMSVAAVLFAVGMANAVSAAPIRADTPAGMLGIGQRTTVRPGFVQTDMKPIPGTDANNVGLARPGDNIAAICVLTDNNLVQWVLSLNRNGTAGQQFANTAGYIQRRYLVDNFSVNPCSTGWPPSPPAAFITFAALDLVDIKPYPGPKAPNAGLIKGKGGVVVFCSLFNEFIPWQLVIHPSGRAGEQYPNTAGFVRDSDLETDGRLAPSCGVS